LKYRHSLPKIEFTGPAPVSLPVKDYVVRVDIEHDICVQDLDTTRVIYFSPNAALALRDALTEILSHYEEV